MKIVHHSLLISAAALASVGSARAATITKAGSGSDLVLGTSWTGLFAPGSGDVATWGASSLAGTQTLGLNVTWGSIDTTAIAGALTLQGNGLTTGKITLASGGTGSVNVITTGASALSIVNDIVSTAAFTGTRSVGDSTSRIQFSASGAGAITLNGNVTVNGGAGANDANLWLRGSTTNSVINGNITVDGQLAKGDAGTWTLNGANTLGWVYVNNGTLLAGSDTAFGAGTVHLASGGGNMTLASKDATARTFVNALNLANLGVGVASFGRTSGGTGALSFGGAVNLGTSARSVATNANTTWSGVVSGVGGGITKSGAGTLTLSNANSYSGGTIVSAGAIQVNASAALGTGAVTVGNGAGAAQINLANGVTIANALTLGANTGVAGAGVLQVKGTDTATWSGAITINNSPSNGGHFHTDSGATLNITNTITASVGVVQRTGTVVLSGGGSYSNYNLTGTLKAGANNGVATNATVTLGVSAAGTLDLNGYNQTLAGVTKGANAATVTNTGPAASTLTINNSGAVTYAGVIANGAGGLALAQSGAGTLTLTGANTHAGGTTVNAGTLVTGHTSALGTGNLAVNAGTLKIGDGLTNTATLGAGASLTLASGATLKLGSATSLITLAGAGGHTFAAGSTIDLNGVFNGLGATTTYTLITGGSGAKTDNGVSVSGYSTGVFSSVTFDGATGNLVFTAVPEPHTVGLLGAGFLAAAAMLRRRKARIIA